MIELSLPMPPSVNSIWRPGINKRTGKPCFYLDGKYADWKRRANNYYLAQRRTIGPPIIGRFNAEIIIDRRKARSTSDLDNRAKCPMDFLQKVGLIENDNRADNVEVKYGEAPEGCIVKAWSVLEAPPLRPSAIVGEIIHGGAE